MTQPVSDAALDAAVDAYDATRIRLNQEWHGGRCHAMSDANKASIRPMIAAAIAAALQAEEILGPVAIVGPSLLREPAPRAPEGCYCTDRCMAPCISGRQMHCRRSPPLRPGQPIPREDSNVR